MDRAGLEPSPADWESSALSIAPWPLRQPEYSLEDSSIEVNAGFFKTLIRFKF